jgi:hypothetical protein
MLLDGSDRLFINLIKEEKDESLRNNCGENY